MLVFQGLEVLIYIALNLLEEKGLQYRSFGQFIVVLMELGVLYIHVGVLCVYLALPWLYTFEYC